MDKTIGHNVPYKVKPPNPPPVKNMDPTNPMTHCIYKKKKKLLTGACSLSMKGILEV